jgi:hypothetical protein
MRARMQELGEMTHELMGKIREHVKE